MNDTSVVLALIGIASTIIASVLAAATWTQKKLVEVLQNQVASEQAEKRLVAEDNRAQAAVIAKLGVSVDKLTEQGAQTIRLLEDVVYGRETATTPRRRAT